MTSKEREYTMGPKYFEVAFELQNIILEKWQPNQPVFQLPSLFGNIFKRQFSFLTVGY